MWCQFDVNPKGKFFDNFFCRQNFKVVINLKLRLSFNRQHTWTPKNNDTFLRQHIETYIHWLHIETYIYWLSFVSINTITLNHLAKKNNKYNSLSSVYNYRIFYFWSHTTHMNTAAVLRRVNICSIHTYLYYILLTMDRQIVGIFHWIFNRF